MTGDSHSHHNHSIELTKASKTRLLFSVFLTIVFMFLEIFVGVIADSLALLSDAAHMLNDVASLLLALITIRLLERQPTYSFTYGYRRAEVFSGFINAISLLFIAAYILYEAFERAVYGFKFEVQGGLVLIVGVIGLLVNIFVVLLLLPVKEGSLNIEGAFHHVMADILGSLGAIIAGLGIMLFQAYWLDTFVSLFIVLLISKNAFSLLLRSSKVFMEVSPDNVSTKRVLEEIKALPGVINIHDFHAWILSTNYYVVTAHVITEKLENIPLVTKQIHKILHNHGFNHVTVQVEIEQCLEDHDCVSDSPFL